MGVLEFKDAADAALVDLADADVMRVMRSGSLSALAILYQRYGMAVYRLGLRILGNPDEAEDLTQEVFLTFWRTETYDPSRGTVVVFLLTLTRSRALNRLQQVRSHRQRLHQWHHDRRPHACNLPLENASLEELSYQVSAALKALPESQRRVLEMAYYEGLSQSEITERLSIPLGTVKTRSRLGLLKLRQLLQDWVE